MNYEIINSSFASHISSFDLRFKIMKKVLLRKHELLRINYGFVQFKLER